MAENETNSLHERLATAEATIVKLERVIVIQAARIVELSLEDGDGGPPNRAQLLAECRVLSRRWAETDAQLEQCRKDANENLDVVLGLRRQVIRLEREINELCRLNSSTPDDATVMHSKQQEEVESEETKTVKQFFSDLATYRGNESGIPKKLRAALEARIKLVIDNARRFSGYVRGRRRSLSSPPKSSAVVADGAISDTVVPDKDASSTVDACERIAQLELEDDDDDVRSPPTYHCRATLLSDYDL